MTDNKKEDDTPNINIHKHPREGDNARPYPREGEDDDTPLPLPSFIITSHTTPHEVSKMLTASSHHDTTHLLDDSMSATDDSMSLSSTPSVATAQITGQLYRVVILICANVLLIIITIGLIMLY